MLSVSLSQKKPLPENIINKNKKFYIESMLGRLSNANNFLEKKIIETYIKKFSYKTIQATCEDYRAGASIDLLHHSNDKAKNLYDKISEKTTWDTYELK